MDDWVEEFKNKSLEEMEMEIRAFKYYLPLPWYRKPCQWFVCGSITIGCGGGFLSCIALSGFESFWFMFLPFGLMAYALVGICLMGLYDKFGSDPLSIMEDESLVIEGLEAGHEYCYISKPSGYITKGVT